VRKFKNRDSFKITFKIKERTLNDIAIRGENNRFIENSESQRR